MSGNSDLKVIGATKKLISNAGYGCLIMDREKFTNVKYKSKAADVRVMVNDGAFMDATEIGPSMYEVKMKKGKITYNLPTVLGFQILNQAKVQLLKLYYEYLMKYYKYNSFCVMLLDTDSIYGSYSSRLIDDMIKSPELLRKFKNRMYNSCHDNDVNLDNEIFLPRACCDRHRLIDTFFPGGIKLESRGERLIALASKTYLLTDSEDDKVKMSCKGAMHDLVVSPLDIFKNVLETGKTQSVDNIGIRFINNKVWTYAQQRNCFSFVYRKRSS